MIKTESASCDASAIRDAQDRSKRVDLGNTVKEMVDSRKALLTEGEKLQADLKKLVLSTRSSPFAQGATTLQSETLLVQMANWRCFAGRDQDNVTLFANI